MGKIIHALSLIIGYAQMCKIFLNLMRIFISFCCEYVDFFLAVKMVLLLRREAAMSTLAFS